MSLAAPSCVQKLRTASPAPCSELWSVCLFREPDAGNLPVRFDEREEETEPSQTGLRRRCAKVPSTTTGKLKSLRLFSTLLPITLKVSATGSMESYRLAHPQTSYGCLVTHDASRRELCIRLYTSGVIQIIPPRIRNVVEL